MTIDEIFEGVKVWYRPFSGAKEEEAVITGGPYSICNTPCCKIDIRVGVVDIESLTRRY